MHKDVFSGRTLNKAIPFCAIKPLHYPIFLHVNSSRSSSVWVRKEPQKHDKPPARDVAAVAHFASGHLANGETSTSNGLPERCCRQAGGLPLCSFYGRISLERQQNFVCFVHLAAGIWLDFGLQIRRSIAPASTPKLRVPRKMQCNPLPPVVESGRYHELIVHLPH